jgi:precorrin-2 dehydrogenase/sirohydrochlorin ferrochelatase
MAVAPEQEHERRFPPILPVALLLEGRPCLVVGAGTVAARKAENLIEAGARVTVVGGDSLDAVRGLHARGAIRLVERAFQDADVAGQAVVFAATDDAEANLRVLAACRRRGILCGCVDLHWRESDFISPAVLRTDDITVAVSSAGQSCRRSRLIRDSLSRHLASVNASDLLVIGTSHRQIPLRRLEDLSLGARLEETGGLLQGIWGLHEFLLLSTCNRVELLALASTERMTHELARRAMGFGALEPDAFYVRQGFDAFEHAALLAAGLLSQTPGESHIVAQLKDAGAASERLGWSGSILRAWLAHALHVSKDIRAATACLLRGDEVEDLILGFLTAWRPGFQDQCGMVIGTGAIGSGLMDRLMASPGAGRIFWCYHTRKPQLRPEWNGRVAAVPLNEIGTALNRAAFIVAAAGGAEHVLQPRHAPMFGAGGALIIDAGMPRNVDPELAVLAAGVRILNLDDLKPRPDGAADGIARAVGMGRQIANEHRDLYEKTIHNVPRRRPDK